jgi:hypothetical protein
MGSRRQYLTTVGSCLSAGFISGCVGILPTDSTDSDYPGGTVVVENTSDASLSVSVTVVEDGYDASIETTLSGGETLVEREFVTVDEGAVITLAARIGDSGDPTTFRFLPAGGEDDTPPEVARLTIENAVEASATWTAMGGK